VEVRTTQKIIYKLLVRSREKGGILPPCEEPLRSPHGNRRISSGTIPVRTPSGSASRDFPETISKGIGRVKVSCKKYTISRIVTKLISSSQGRRIRRASARYFFLALEADAELLSFRALNSLEPGLMPSSLATKPQPFALFFRYTSTTVPTGLPERLDRAATR